MNEDFDPSPFDELPEALVEDMLNQSNTLGEKLSHSFNELCKNRINYRTKLEEENLLRKDTDIISTYNYPTTCGVDGSYAVEKLLSTDLVAVAGVAVEGLTPPTEKRHWPKPRHYSNIISVAHNDATTVVARAVMMSMELELAAKAPHDVVFIDNSLTTPLIYYNQALNQISNVSDDLLEIFNEKIEIGLKSYLEILEARRTDKIYAGVPKYTTKNEITKGIFNIYEYDDRGFLSLILEAKEFIKPLSLEKPSSKWHINNPPIKLKETINKVISGLDNLNVVYYRPYYHFPTLRLEISKSIASNNQRLAILLESISQQCGAPGIMEPYPLYLADRMVKHLGTALPAIRKTVTQEMAMEWTGELGDIYLSMHGYRTEIGR